MQKNESAVDMRGKILLDVNEAMAYTSLGRNTITQLINDPSTGIGRFCGRKKLAHRPTLDKYIEQNRRLI